MSLQPPFALFVTAQTIDVDYINDSLTRAWKGNFEASWDLWVSSQSYDDAPKKRDDNELPEGTRAPIPKSFSSPWIGKSFEDCAKWLQEAPDNVAVHKQYFTVMDEHSKEDDTVMLCRIVKSDESGEVELEYFPQETGSIVMNMATNGGIKFDEKCRNYQVCQKRDGKPDRSKGGPYA